MYLAKSYGYDGSGHRTGMTYEPYGADNQPDPTKRRLFSYGYDVHGSISLLLDQTGAAQESYGYQPYGAADPDLTKSIFTPNPGDPIANPYRYTARRLDTASGSFDMGARRFTASPGRFLQQDLYFGALSNLGLSLDPLTQNRYALAGGNPVSFVEVDGHEPAADGSDQSGGNGSQYWENYDPPTRTPATRVFGAVPGC